MHIGLLCRILRQIYQGKSKGIPMKYLWPFVFFIFLAHIPYKQANAETNHGTDEAEFLAAKITGEIITGWLRNLEKRPESIGIFQINTNHPLKKDFSKVLEVELIKRLRSERIMRILACPECQVPQLRVQEDRVLITKGSPDLDTLKGLSKKYNVNTFLTLEVYRTKLSLMTMAKLFHAGSGEVLATESFRVPALNLRGAATQVMLQLGPGIPFGGQDLGSEEAKNSFVGNLALLEELGFGKGGLVIGFATGNKSTLTYILPTIGWRDTFGNSSLQGLKSLGLGLGVSEGVQGLAIRGAYDLFLGSFVGLGIQGGFLLPFRENKPRSEKILSGFIGAHIIFTLGR